MFNVTDVVYLINDLDIGDGVFLKSGTKGVILKVFETSLLVKFEEEQKPVSVRNDEVMVFPDDDFSQYMNPPQEEVSDQVNHPSHYETGKFECIEVMEEALGYDAVRDFCICNAFKYIYRHKRKNGCEDIKKAQWYINKYVDMTEKAKENGLTPM